MRFKIFIIILIATSLHAVPGYFEPWGKDTDLIYSQPRVPNHAASLSLLGHVMQLIIRFHQTVISPADGPRSHFKPSSSNYMLQAIQKHGFFQGYIMGCDRLIRENSDPWVYRTAQIDGKIWKTDPP